MGVAIKSEDIDNSAEVRPDLATDNQQFNADEGRICADHVLKASLQTQWRIRDRHRPRISHPPDCHLNRHPCDPCALRYGDSRVANILDNCAAYGLISGTQGLSPVQRKR